jgi:hypothetical protein
MGTGENGNKIIEKRISAYPNPFKDQIRIKYLNDKVVFDGLDIFDISGRHLKDINEPDMIWNGADDAGNELPPAIYFVKDRESGQTLKIIKTE